MSVYFADGLHTKQACGLFSQSKHTTCIGHPSRHSAAWCWRSSTTFLQRKIRSWGVPLSQWLLLFLCEQAHQLPCLQNHCVIHAVVIVNLLNTYTGIFGPTESHESCSKTIWGPPESQFVEPARSDRKQISKAIEAGVGFLMTGYRKFAMVIDHCSRNSRKW